MRLDKRAVILPGKDILYVINRRGSFEVRGKGIDKLHAQFQKHFDGSHEEEWFLEFLPRIYAPMVRSYFSKMKDIGVIITSSHPTSPIIQLDPLSLNNGRTRLAVKDKTILVSCDTWEHEIANDCNLNIFLVTTHEMGGVLFHIERIAEVHSDNIFVVIKARMNLAFSNESTAFCSGFVKCLIRNYLETGERSRAVIVYEMDEQSGAVERVLSLVKTDNAESDYTTIPTHLGMVDLSDLDQIPLVSVAASHPYFGSNTLFKYGLDYDRVRADALLSFTSQLCMSVHRKIDFEVEKLGLTGNACEDRVTCTLDLGINPTIPLAAASNKQELLLKCLERYEFDRWLCQGNHTGLTVDVVQTDHQLESIRHLSAALKLRKKHAPVTLYQTSAGLYIFKSEEICGFSFLHDKALHDMLISLIAESFYATQLDPEEVCSSFDDFASPHDQTRIIREALRYLCPRHPQLSLRYKEIRLWGADFYLGWVSSGDCK